MTVRATYIGEELIVTFVAQTDISDHGVPNSPVWREMNPDTIDILTCEILGIDVDPHKLPIKLRAAIYALANEAEFE